MQKTILWKDAWQAITHSLGRYIAIILLIALGTFAFTGLKWLVLICEQQEQTFLLNIT